MKNLKTIGITLLLLSIFFSVSAQQVIKEYKIKNLISDVVMQKFEQINTSIEIFDHKEGNQLILVGDSLAIEQAIELLEILDLKQMMVTVEFMLVEYFHENNFEWGIDITQGKSGNFNNINYTPGAVGDDFSFGFSAITQLVPSFQVNIRALVADDKAKVLTNPHLSVLSGTPASIDIKDRREIILETATINGVTTTLQNIEAGITLSVTPIPTHDSLIHLDIQGVVSEFLPFSNEGEFIIEENKINTQVDVRSGETLIIGGLIMEETNTLEGGVPFLKDIPLLGLLFKKRKEVTNYIERVIYITPYIIPEDHLKHYSAIRKMTQFEKDVQQVIETDPGFLKNETTKKSMRKNRKARRKNKNASTNDTNGNN